jgi:hypothetical protein
MIRRKTEHGIITPASGNFNSLISAFQVGTGTGIPKAVCFSNATSYPGPSSGMRGQMNLLT